MRPSLLVLPFLLLGCQIRDSGSSAEGAVDSLGLAEDLRIDAETADLTRVGFMLVSRSGEIVVTQSQDEIIKVFPPSGEVRVVGRKGGGPGEFTNLTRIGWLGDSLWTLDPGLKRISIFGPDLEYVRSFPDPLEIDDGTPATAAASEPLSIFIQSVLPGGDLRASASFRMANRPSWAAGLDSGTTALMRIAPDGRLLRRLGVRTPDPCAVPYAIGERGMGVTRIPFCSRHIDTAWEGGDDLLFLDVDEPADASGRYRVTRISSTGDTNYSRTFDYVPIPVTQAAIDSLAARMAEAFASLPQQVLDVMPKPEPEKHFAPIRRVLLGRDGSAWLEEHSLIPGHHWLVLDPDGEPGGRVTVPANFRLMAAEVGTIWGLEEDEDGLESIVRYRVR